MTTAYDPNANDYNDANDGTYSADDTPARSSSDLPDGTYRARAVEWSWDTAKSGEPCIALMFELLDHNGYRIDGRLYLDTDKQDSKGRTSLDRSMEALRAMGLQGPIVADLQGLDAGEVSLVTEHNQKGYPAVRWINAPRKARELRTFEVPQTGALNGFLAKLNARMQSVTAGQRASGTAPMAAPIVQPASQQRPVARPQPAAQGRPAQEIQVRRVAPAQQPAQKAPPKLHGQTAGEFGDDSDVPF